MANVKSVAAMGQMPFNILDEASERLVRFFAMFSMPSWGLKIYYGDECSMHNEHGGQTVYYRFKIVGQEAVSRECIIQDLAEMHQAGAMFSTIIVKDMEEGDAWDLFPEVMKASDLAKERKDAEASAAR